MLADVSLLEHDQAPILEIIKEYTINVYYKRLFSLLSSMPNLEEHGRLLFLNQHLVIPNILSLCAQLFHFAHNVGGYFSANKTYESLCSSFYWPNMQCYLVNSYISRCLACMCNKSLKIVPAESLHPLLVSDVHGT